MTYTPALFKNIAKSVKDLFDEKFKDKRELVLKSTTANGTKLETGAHTSGSGYDGHVKATHKNSDIGTFEVELGTEGTAKYSLKSDKVADGTTIKLTGDQDPTGKFDVEYRKDFLAFALNLAASSVKANAAASAVVGFDGLAVGGETSFDIKKQDLKDYNAGVEYADTDFTVSVKTEDKANKINLGFVQQVSAALAAGATVGYNIGTNERLLTLGSKYNFGAKNDTYVILKGNTAGTIASYFEHRIANPSVSIGLMQEYKAQKASATPEKFGITLTFGELDN